MNRGQGRSSDVVPWHAQPYSADNRAPVSHGDAFVFGAFVVFVTHDLRRIELRCIPGGTIIADRRRMAMAPPSSLPRGPGSGIAALRVVDSGSGRSGEVSPSHVLTPSSKRGAAL